MKGTKAAPAAATPVVQFNGSRIQMPAKRPFSRMSRLKLQIDPRWTNGYGYRPVELTITPQKPFTSSRRIRIRIHTGWNQNMQVDQEIELPAGANNATATISLPTYLESTSNYFWWEVWVDGVLDKDLITDRTGSMAWMGNLSGSSAGLTFLLAGPQKDDRSLITTAATEFDVLTLELAKFPTQWIDYTSMDVVGLSLGELERLKKERPAAFDAIARWVRAGGQLWVSDLGKEFEKLPALSVVLGLSESLLLNKTAGSATTSKEESSGKVTADEKDRNATAPADNNPEMAELNAEVAQATVNDAQNTGDVEIDEEQPNTSFGWRPLRFTRRISDGRVVTFRHLPTGTSRKARDPEMIARMEQDPNFSKTEEGFDPVYARGRRVDSDSSPWYVEQSLGLGTVRAFRGANDVATFARSPAAANPNAIANADAPGLFDRRQQNGLVRPESWDSRHGMTPDSGNVEFARFFVPGVGRAPVHAFEVLITLFVLLIGPVNYWYLKRYKRIHLMVLTVPLAAAVTTLTLFAYAILADGFATRVRARSFTTLDQRSGEAACWTWLSYYSGLAPGDGLTMPADLVLYPIQPGWASDRDVAQSRALVWDGDQARLTQGWLNSRTPTQYLTVRSRKTPHRLEVEQSQDRLRVRNRLGTSIKTLVVVGEDGKLYAGENIADAALQPLNPIDRDVAVRRLGGLVVENLPKAPDELATTDSELAAMTSGSRYRRYGRYGGRFSGGRMLENLAGSAISELAGRTEQPGLDLPPRSYVAITDSGPEVETGISYATEEASFHMLEGKW
jgi:hypothetical protein